HLDFIGLAQHFADATGESESPKTQMSRFWPVVEELRGGGVLPPEIHLAASGGSMNYPESRGTMIRTGIGAYGVDPKNYLRGNARPSLSWFARVTAMRTVAKGEPIGYGGTFTTSRPTKVATLGVGYGDGYGRQFSNKAWVMIQGHRAPVIGLVCMDQTMVDITDLPPVELGDVATLIGEGVRAEQLADLIGTNPHEVLCRIMTRVPRRYLNRD
ncbi:MAG: alanine racemase, partial [Fimbriimonadaceae bacterium]|nr:alanine racemase [Fimbriimonadaceae bacterium]